MHGDPRPLPREVALPTPKEALMRMKEAQLRVENPAEADQKGAFSELVDSVDLIDRLGLTTNPKTAELVGRLMGHLTSGEDWERYSLYAIDYLEDTRPEDRERLEKGLRVAQILKLDQEEGPVKGYIDSKKAETQAAPGMTPEQRAAGFFGEIRSVNSNPGHLSQEQVAQVSNNFQDETARTLSYSEEQTPTALRELRRQNEAMTHHSLLAAIPRLIQNPDQQEFLTQFFY